MDKKQDEPIRRPLYLYDLPPEILSTLSLKTDAGFPAQQQQQQQQEQEQEQEQEQLPHDTPDQPQQLGSDPAAPDTAAGSHSCSLCSLAFANAVEQRGHLKTDLHHYNLKQKLNGLSPVSEPEFEKLVANLDESISGSDSSPSEDEEDEPPSRKETTLVALLKKQATLADKRDPDVTTEDSSEARKKRRGAAGGSLPLLWFNSPTLPDRSCFGAYRALFTAEELAKEDAIIDAIRQRQLAPISMPKTGKDGNVAPSAHKGRHIFMCMIGGGHVAAMVVSLAPRQTKNHAAGPLNREAIVLAHKTFHRYTTRRKQGGSQSANDNAKGTAHSAGSSLRRYNEQALVEDVRALLADWKPFIDTADLLFIRATGATNRRTLFGPYDGQVLRANDARVRGFPFSTRRATQNELMRSFIELTRLKVKEIEVEAAPRPGPDASSKQPDAAPSKPAPSQLTEEEQAALLHTTQIQALVRRSKLPALLSYLATNSLTANFRFEPADHHAPTALHLSAAQNSAPLVTGLLTRGGADPTAPNGDGRTPFELAGDRATRDAFRVARAELGEAAWDWDAARVPAALLRSDAEQRTERERKEKEAKEADRRKTEEERLRAAEGPSSSSDKVRSGKRTRGVVGVIKTPQEKRDEEVRGLTPEQRMRLDRERRARAAEERIKRLQGGG
ncbi:hypothetical protein B0T24DRAFT_634606 [Lasiosphaeria ovina]|uniref:VLRF1 domain-containing protein n=1 Tax=Lasiosphaeria ovina TaxID=92902 RepID=A0AAE0JZ42_9PEZI|nr:hypothetical protein B0T24DRAFT_634606 [Lasiosphaeria ovina]